MFQLQAAPGAASPFPTAAERSLEYRMRSKPEVGGQVAVQPATSKPIFDAPQLRYAVVEVVHPVRGLRPQYFSTAAAQLRTEYVIGRACRIIVCSECAHTGGVVCYRTLKEACLAAQQLEAASTNRRSEKRQVMQLRIAYGAKVVCSRRAGETRASAVIPQGVAEIPSWLERYTRPRKRWWSPAYGLH